MDIEDKVELVWVAELSGCYGFRGTYYGPSAKPLQVPINLAQSAGLEILENPPEGAEVEPKGDVELKVAFDKLKGEHATLETTHKQAVDAGNALQSKVTELQTTISDMQADAQVTEREIKTALEEARLQVEDLSKKLEAAQGNSGKPTPAVLPSFEELVAINGVGDKLARVILDLLEKKQQPTA